MTLSVMVVLHAALPAKPLWCLPWMCGESRVTVQGSAFLSCTLGWALLCNSHYQKPIDCAFFSLVKSLS